MAIITKQKKLSGFTIIEILELEGDSQCLPVHRLLLDAENFVRFCNSNMLGQVFHKGCVYFVLYNGYCIFCRLEDE